jgi:hypothetical protein
VLRQAPDRFNLGADCTVPSESLGVDLEGHSVSAAGVGRPGDPRPIAAGCEKAVTPSLEVLAQASGGPPVPTYIFDFS